jgi:hypothetical protein
MKRLSAPLLRPHRIDVTELQNPNYALRGIVLANFRIVIVDMQMLAAVRRWSR